MFGEGSKRSKALLCRMLGRSGGPSKPINEPCNPCNCIKYPPMNLLTYLQSPPEPPSTGKRALELRFGLEPGWRV